MFTFVMRVSRVDAPQDRINCARALCGIYRILLQHAVDSLIDPPEKVAPDVFSALNDYIALCI